MSFGEICVVKFFDKLYACFHSIIRGMVGGSSEDSEKLPVLYSDAVEGCEFVDLGAFAYDPLSARFHTSQGEYLKLQILWGRRKVQVNWE